MSLVVQYLPTGEVEYIGDCDHGTLWFHLNPQTGGAKFFDENAQPIDRPSYAKNANLYQLTGLMGE